MTRAEAAAIICRVVLPAERKTLDLQAGPSNLIDVDAFFGMKLKDYTAWYTPNYYGYFAGGLTYHFDELPGMTFFFSPEWADDYGTLNHMACQISQVFPEYHGKTLE